MSLLQSTISLGISLILLFVRVNDLKFLNLHISTGKEVSKLSSNINVCRDFNSDI